MESYRGLAVLATNRKGDLDSALMRRLRFVVYFSFPDGAWRAELWRRASPGTMPTDPLDYAALARLDLSGGSIPNALTMEHVLEATRGRQAKLDRPVTRT